SSISGSSALTAPIHYPSTTLFRSRAPATTPPPRRGRRRRAVRRRMRSRCGQAHRPHHRAALSGQPIEEEDLVLLLRIAAHTGLEDPKRTRLNSSHVSNSYPVFCFK